VAQFFLQSSYGLWVSKHRKVQVPFGTHWILNDSTGVLDVTKLLKLLRLEVYKASPLLWQLFDFSTLYIDRPDKSKSCMEVLINKMFYWMVKLYGFKFLLVQ